MLLPRFVRKLLAVLRGSVAPPLIFLSVLLGFWLGLMPGWSGLHTALAVFVLVLNVHIGLFLLSMGAGKAAAFATAPLLYHTGVWMHAHMGGLLATLSATPIVGLTDFGRYALAGAMVIGPILGAIAGLFLAFSVLNFRRMMVKVDQKSEKFHKWYSQRWVRILDRLLIGRRTKDVQSMFVKAKYLRKAGVVLAVIVVGGFLGAARLMQNTTIRDYATRTLTQANKAEANLAELGINILGGNVHVADVQLTDPQNPEQNHLTIGTIGAHTNVRELLLGRLVMEKVEISEVRFNQARQSPGKVLEVPAQEEESFDPNTYKIDPNDLGKLDKYVKDARKLKEQLEKLRNWLPDGKEAGPQAEEPPHKYLDYLVARAATPPVPRILAKLLLADKTEIPSPLFGNSRVEMMNVSEAPAAAALPVVMQIQSYVTPALLRLVMDYSKGDTPEVSGTFEGFDLSTLQSEFSQDAGLEFQSGLAGGTFAGILTKDHVDLTIGVAIKNLKATGVGKGVLGLGAKETSRVMEVLNELKTTIRVVGPTTEPRLVFDTKGLTKEFQNALVAAGKQRLQQEIDTQLQKHLGDKLDGKLPADLQDKLKAPSKDLVEGLGGLLGGRRKQEEK
jgi:uncharacterized protein (TIGR03546 family)